MAFDFLDNIGIGDVGNLLKFGGQVAGVSNILKGYQPTAAEGNTNQALSNQKALLQALLDSNNPIYKNIVAGQQQQLNNQTQLGLNNLMQMQRKAQLMGRGTYFNPERQDESISRYLSSQSDNNAATARSNALKQILDAAGGYSQQAGNFRQMIPFQQQAQNQNATALPKGLGGIGDIIGQFGANGSMSNIGNALSSALPSIMTMF